VEAAEVNKEMLQQVTSESTDLLAPANDELLKEVVNG
jgi:hypothetical protein